MNKVFTFSEYYFFLISLLFMQACYGQGPGYGVPEASSFVSSFQTEKQSFPHQLLGPYGNMGFSSPDLGITAYISSIFQDRTGVLWFGTIGRGVIRYNGTSIHYFSTPEGFAGKEVRDIVGDQLGNVWFATEEGICKYSPTSKAKLSGAFVNYSEKDGLINKDVWSLALDREGSLWIGTLQGVCRYDPIANREQKGKAFSYFPLPKAEPDDSRRITSDEIVHDIMEDSQGNIWFGTNGGAYRYSPNSDALINLSEQDGLCNNAVNRILEDQQGQFWFATQHEGVCRLDGRSLEKGRKVFSSIETEKGFQGANISSDVLEDASGNIWFPIEGVGMHRFDGRSIRDFFRTQHCLSHTIRCAYEDREGRIWFGGWLGLHRYDG